MIKINSEKTLPNCSLNNIFKISRNQQKLLLRNNIINKVNINNTIEDCLTFKLA